MRLTFLITIGIFAIVLSACTHQMSATREGAPLARQMTESDQCGLGSGGLTYISQRQELDRLRRWPAQNLSMKLIEALDFDHEHLLIVGLGQKSTGGFGVTLANSQIIDNTLRLTVFLRRPPVGAIVPQVITTPCAVLAITPEHWDRVEVNGNGLETLQLNR